MSEKFKGNTVLALPSMDELIAQSKTVWGDGVAYWDIALTVAEIEALKAGVSPGDIRPEHLLIWRPMTETKTTVSLPETNS